MVADSIAGFWSYAHDDDSLDEGAIVKLAHLISDEYNLLSGEKLVLFVDRDDISWGDTWRDRIERALTQTTFLIPIVTPRYFTRPECRRELMEFSAQAKSLGVDKLLFPIVYAKPDDFSTESSDEAVAMIAATQYVDWTEARLLEPASRAYRTYVNKLALRLIEIAGEVVQEQFNHELDTDPESDGPAGIVDLVEEIAVLLPDWLEAVMTDPFIRSQLDAAMDRGDSQLTRLRKARVQPSVLNAAQLRLAKEALPLLERNHRDAVTYLRRSAQLDPLVSSLIRFVNEHSESYPQTIPVRQAIDEAMQNIRSDERQGDTGSMAYKDYFAQRAYLGRLYQKCATIAQKSADLITEGNDIVMRWDAELVAKDIPSADAESD
jgi:hypothetical protein